MRHKLYSQKFYETYDEVKKYFSFTPFHFLFFYRFKSMTFNVDYVNYDFILLTVKR